MDLFKHRTYPFIFALAILLLTLFVLITTDTTTTTTIISCFQSQPTPSRKASASCNTTSFTDKTDNTTSFTSKTDKNITNNISGVDDADLELIKLEICKVRFAVDYIPCLDNWEAIKQLKSRRHMEHRERHCPSPSPACLIPLPDGYKLPVPWPKSRDMIWYDNVPHPKLVEYKKDQNWVRKSGDYFFFPGGGTQFKDVVTCYIEFIEKSLPKIEWGSF